MSQVDKNRNALSRRSLLGAAGTAIGAAALEAPRAAGFAVGAPANAAASFVRDLGMPDLPCTGPGLQWIDFDEGPISVSLASTGRPVRITARLVLDYGGPDHSCLGLSFAEDGVDLLRDDQQGIAIARLEGSTVVRATMEATTLRQVAPGPHTWTLRVRHENPLSDEAVQRSYVRTRRVAPLEFTAIEL